ncbi:VCBS repeat-containing protein [Spongiimicrobium sp. 3-5]|uniref:VCBS repeat-containing protein n=1 Tax=Spongiimicrobium sp. 3-5 TaxID=3332596 RepID=UPI00398152F2
MKYFKPLIGVFCSLLFLVACKKEQTQGFKRVGSSHSGIDFTNTIEENDSINVFSFMNIYTGAGVAVGDINNDGLTDIYFSGNMVSGRLYLNKGNLQFEDISDKAGILNKSWGTGVTMVDINQDGFLDIYVCVSGGAPIPQRANLLYINNGDLTFTEKAEEYGLADTRQSMQAAFFDFDKDHDLDLYLLVNPAAYEHGVNSSMPRKLNGESISTDRLYRNDGNGKFTDVSTEAGILVEGYGLGVGISDINNDSWPDIYVSNDFIGNDILYINQGDGTFKDQISDQIKHTSYAGMGNDVADIDNNGKPDIVVLDMRPEDNTRQKLIISSTGYDRFQMMLEAGYDPQYSRNTLQLNQGEDKFSEIGFLAGVSSTDWSWSALLADYDNDGYKDMYVTNGFLRDLGNLDYIHYQNIYDNPLGDVDTKIKQKLSSINELPKAQLINYAYRNKGDMTFENVSENWGIEDPSCSNGAAYADLDNDGDLDLIVNNVDQPAFLYENLRDRQPANNALSIRLKGKKGNLGGIGAKIKITTPSTSQYYEHYLSRGYESSVDPTIHFGLGEHKKASSIEIWWPDNSYQLLENTNSDQLLVLDQSKASFQEASGYSAQKNTLVSNITDSLGIGFEHREDPMVDFKLQPILPHMHSRNGPGMAVADINADGYEDFYIGGAAGQAGQIFLQQGNGTFSQDSLAQDKEYEDMGSLFFDANADGHPDLYIVSGGVQISDDDKNYQDRLYLNDGAGNFVKSDALPNIPTSGSNVTAIDFDQDGDLDLFVGGRVNPGKYPMPAKSYLLENLHDQDPNNLKFRDISNSIDGWDILTMVSSALWTDYDGDGWRDLIAVGEFMPVVFFHNENGKLVYVKDIPDLDKTEGWWNSIAGGDFDNDGDTDYILGNLGLNSKYNASPDEPLCIYAKDYDKDGRIDPVMCYYIDGENYIAHTRDEIITQINAMRVRFKTYQQFAETTFEKSFLPEELKDSYVVKSHNLASSYMENLGNGSFKMRSLPLNVQIGPVEGIVIEDIDLDGNEDIVLTGNSYATEVAMGRFDAFMGAVLLGDGSGGFKTLTLAKSGFVNDYDGSALGILRNPAGTPYLLSANNNGPMAIHAINTTNPIKPFLAAKGDISAEVILKNGARKKVEFYYGSGYLSQSSRSITIHGNVKEINVTNFKGNTKTVYTHE